MSTLNVRQAPSEITLPVSTETSEAASDAYLSAQLERIDLKLQQYVQHIHERADDKHNMQGLVLASEHLQQLLARPEGRPYWAQQPRLEIVEPKAQQDKIQLADESRLGQLISRFALTAFEVDLLLLSVLPWFDYRYSVLFAFIQDDAQKKLPTVALALQLLCSGRHRPAAQAYLLPQAKLFFHGLLNLKGKGNQSKSNWGDTLLQADVAVYHYLLGQDALPPVLARCAHWLTVPKQGLNPQSELIERIARYCFDHQTLAAPILFLRGHRHSGRAQTVAFAANSAGRQALCLDAERLPEDDKDALDVLLLALREVRLRAACLILKSLSALAETRATLFAQFSDRIETHQGPLVCLIEGHTPLIWFSNMPQLLLDMPKRSLAEDEAILRSHLQFFRLESDLDLTSLVKRFHLSLETLPQTLQEADLYRAQRSSTALLSKQDLHTAFRLRAQQNFGKLAQRITPSRTFDDLIINDDLMLQLQEIRAAIRYREHALEQGFSRKIAYGTGISALFYGDSGTGKTLVAEVLAGTLGVDLIKVDLSTVVNKYIGETEKNLSRIFDLAAADAGVLFFDEADALFGKRSETKDAHDRHANIEVSYLLQRLENYPGLVILATNNRTHLDKAFTRRLTFITRFSFPDKPLRERIWRSIWPPTIALSDEIDFGEFASKAEVTGANIRNIALLATWLAKEEQAPYIRSAHIERALRRELSKMGRIIG